MTDAPQPPATQGRAIVAFVGGGEARHSLDAALALLGGLDWAAGVAGPVLVLVGAGRAEDSPGSAATALTAALRGATRAEVRIARPPSALDALRSSAGEPAWAALPAALGAERFDRVLVPRRIATAGALGLVVPPVTRRATGPLALELLARHTHPRQALAARLDRRRLGVAAELASPLRPRLIVVPAALRDQPLIAVTGDRIAAELVGLALRAELTANGDAGTGPWEDPLVQRATELDLGARLPRDLSILDDWTGDAGSPSAAAFRAMTDRIRLRLGVPAAGPGRSPVAP